MQHDFEKVPVEDSNEDRLRKELDRQHVLITRMRGGAALLETEVNKLKDLLRREQEKAANYQTAFNTSQQHLGELKKRFGNSSMPSYVVPESSKQLISSLLSDNEKYRSFIKCRVLPRRQDGPDIIRELEQAKVNQKLLRAKAQTHERVAGLCLQYMRQEADDLEKNSPKLLAEKDQIIAIQEQRLHEFAISMKACKDRYEGLFNKMKTVDSSAAAVTKLQEKLNQLELKEKKLVYENQLLSNQISVQGQAKQCDGTCEHTINRTNQFDTYRSAVLAVYMTLGDKFREEESFVSHVHELMESSGLIDPSHCSTKQEEAETPPKSQAKTAPALNLPPEPYMTNSPRFARQIGLIVADGTSGNTADASRLSTPQQGRPSKVSDVNSDEEEYDVCKYCDQYIPTSQGPHICKKD